MQVGRINRTDNSVGRINTRRVDVAGAIGIDSHSGFVYNQKTFAHTITSGTKLFVGFGSRYAGDTLSGITYDGVALTNITFTGLYGTCSVWYLDNPPVGTHNVVVTTTALYTASGAISVYGAAGGVPPSAVAYNVKSIEIVSADGDLVLLFSAKHTTTHSVDAPAVKIADSFSSGLDAALMLAQRDGIYSPTTTYTAIGSIGIEIVALRLQPA